MARLGIDVGGTNTDAVLLDRGEVIAWAKHPTTPDVSSGIFAAVRDVLAHAPLAPREISAVMLGTTHFTNAVVQRRDLAHIAVIRLGLPATTSIPPLEDWPDDLRETVAELAVILPGGHQFDGREIAPLDWQALEQLARELRRRGVDTAAVTAVFSPAVPKHEDAVAEFLTAHVPGLRVTRSREIGRIGLLERENAAALNAALVPLAEQTVRAFQQALSELGLEAPLYLSQNDGTLMTAEFAARYPVLTFASGPTNSMRGAAVLSGLRDAIVLDVGGTTTDGGALVGGFPREASFAVMIGGVRTNFRMPDVVSIGLGGGSLVGPDGATVGPQSVGFRLNEEALVFGGSTLTASDIAVAAGRARFGDPSRIAHLPPNVVRRALTTIDQRLSELIDSLKTTRAAVPVIVVGGGSVLVPDHLEGASEVIRPPHAAVANAIGAAIAQVSGEIDRIVSLEGQTREAALTAACADARRAAIEAGADPGSVTVVEIEEIPIAYLPSNAVRVRVKVVGDLRGG
ncbi:hydantoinase/oxoprolinase family protein [Thermomicrobium sp. CFH 73360]|uniref:hydantoinase/oxoprolinase family protein n=1 Tax=Thermomicrobium sp. CFH 73360 TaxID=2951987 RepID=UPI0020776090|nr:hydantoinase/oxoprolinase family protein [Thermomicrobium sp. CFH 73360]